MKHGICVICSQHACDELYQSSSSHMWHTNTPDAMPTPTEMTPARVTPMEMMLPTTDVLTFIIQFIYCRNKSLDWSQPVFEGQLNWIGPVLFGSVAVLQVGAMVWTSCGPQLPPWGGQKTGLNQTFKHKLWAVMDSAIIFPAIPPPGMTLDVLVNNNFG